MEDELPIVWTKLLFCCCFALLFFSGETSKHMLLIHLFLFFFLALSERMSLGSEKVVTHCQ